MVKEITQEEAQRVASVAIDDTIQSLQSYIHILKNIKCNLYLPPVLVSMQDPRDMAEYIQTRLFHVASTVGNAGMHLDIPFSTILRAVTPKEEVAHD